MRAVYVLGEGVQLDGVAAVEYQVPLGVWLAAVAEGRGVFTPRSASSFANARPMPEVAPVMRAYAFGGWYSFSRTSDG